MISQFGLPIDRTAFELLIPLVNAITEASKSLGMDLPCSYPDLFNEFNTTVPFYTADIVCDFQKPSGMIYLCLKLRVDNCLATDYRTIGFDLPIKCSVADIAEKIIDRISELRDCLPGLQDRIRYMKAGLYAEANKR